VREKEGRTGGSKKGKDLIKGFFQEKYDGFIELIQDSY
jgi:hypothetical protein